MSKRGRRSGRIVRDPENAGRGREPRLSELRVFQPEQSAPMRQSARCRRRVKVNRRTQGPASISPRAIRVQLRAALYPICLASGKSATMSISLFWPTRSTRTRKACSAPSRTLTSRTTSTLPDHLPSSGDSGEAERFFRREAERHSGMIPNTIGASRRWQLDCEGKCSPSPGETCPERSGGACRWQPMAEVRRHRLLARAAQQIQCLTEPRPRGSGYYHGLLAGKGVRGKAAGVAPPQLTVTLERE
jgi:hypothetical protein